MADAVQQQSDNYQFNAKPQVVNAKLSKFREPPSNIMWDKRVVRGNTYASIVTSKPDQTIVSQNVKKKKVSKMVAQEFQEEEVDKSKKKRDHQEVQTDENVEMLTDKPPNYEKEAQTDFIIEKEVPRLYMPPKTGVDVETQIWDDGELFNFDYEVEPLLLVLIGKTLELSRQEVLEEEELREMDEQQKYYNELRKAEQAEQERLEQVEQKHFEENERTKQLYRAKSNQAVLAHKKLVSHVLAKQYLSKLHVNTMNMLNGQGFFRPNEQVELIEDFLPWLYDEVRTDLVSRMNTVQEYNQLLNELNVFVQQAHQRVFEQEMKNRADVVEERERLRIEEEERKRKKREAKKQRLEQERRQRLKESIIERIISKGELKALSINNTISDIDGHQQATPFVGIFGGFIGELIIFLSSLQELSNEHGFAPLKQLFASFETIDELIVGLLTSLIPNADFMIEIGISANAEPQLTAIDPNLTIQSLNGAQTQSAQIQTILLENIFSTILNCIHENYLTFGFAKEIIDTIENSVIKHCLTNELFRAKTKFVKVNPSIVSLKHFPCLSKVFPSLSEVPFHPKSGKTRPGIFDNFKCQLKEKVEKEPVVDDGEPEPQEEIEMINPINLAEAQIDSKVTIFANQVEDLQTLVQHCVAEFNLRESVLDALGELIAMDGGSDYQILVESTQKCEAFQNAILDVIASDIPVFEINQY